MMLEWFKLDKLSNVKKGWREREKVCIDGPLVEGPLFTPYIGNRICSTHVIHKVKRNKALRNPKQTDKCANCDKNVNAYNMYKSYVTCL